MRTETINIYEFNELPDAAKEKAIQYFRNSLEFDVELDYYADMLSEKGFERSQISYSGFCSQGDGASFSCTIDIEKLFKGGKLTKYERVYLELVRKGYVCGIKIVQFGHYCHENTMSIESENHFYGLKFPDYWFDAFDDVLAGILEEAKDQARQIYKNLEADYDYQRSDEYIIQMIEANDYEFTDKGELI